MIAGKKFIEIMILGDITVWGRISGKDPIYLMERFTIMGDPHLKWTPAELLEIQEIADEQNIDPLAVYNIQREIRLTYGE